MACAAARLLPLRLLLLAGRGKGQGGAVASLGAVLRTACQAVEPAQAVERRAGRGCDVEKGVDLRSHSGADLRRHRCKMFSNQSCLACGASEQPGVASMHALRRTVHAPVEGEGRPQELNPADSACASWPDPPRL